MKDLKCGMVNCSHNKGYCCCAKSIMVGHDTDCEAYNPVERTRGSMFEVSEEFIPSNYSVDTAVACDANCVFNKDMRCIANGITVMSDRENLAQCLTFIKK